MACLGLYGLNPQTKAVFVRGTGDGENAANIFWMGEEIFVLLEIN